LELSDGGSLAVVNKDKDGNISIIADLPDLPKGEYYDVKYSSMELEGEEFQQELNFKIEIKSDMPL